jgi:hypothetical protein
MAKITEATSHFINIDRIIPPSAFSFKQSAKEANYVGPINIVMLNSFLLREFGMED